MQTSVTQHDFFGERAFLLSAGSYTCMLLPEIGGNLISFRDEERGLSFLRTPTESEMEGFRARPFVYGIPVLFPPNRIEDGTFRSLTGRTYTLPVNEPETHNHLHGFFTSSPWEVVDKGVETSDKGESAYIEIVQVITPDHPVYAYFPHEFTISIRYTLSGAGLDQEVAIVNRGQDQLPLMFGLHTTLNVPFSNRSTEDHYTLKVTVGERWAMTERMLPTGEFQVLTESEQKLKGPGAPPFFAQLDNHYTASPEDGTNYAALTDHHLGLRLVYDVGLQYKQWMVFNNFARGGYVCPEPQTMVVNAPNTGLSDEQSGFTMLGSGQTWAAKSRLYVEEV